MRGERKRLRVLPRRSRVREVNHRFEWLPILIIIPLPLRHWAHFVGLDPPPEMPENNPEKLVKKGPELFPLAGIYRPCDTSDRRVPLACLSSEADVSARWARTEPTEGESAHRSNGKEQPNTLCSP